MNTLRILKLGWKGGLIGLTAMVLAISGLFMSLRSASAISPNMTVLYLVNNETAGGGFGKSTNVSAGQTIQLTQDIHNTVVGSTANNVQIKVSLPSGTGSSTATVFTDNAGNVSDSVSLNVSGGNLQYIPGSTRVTWDKNGDGIKEFNNTPVADGITTSGLTLGNQSGCNAYIIEISFLAKVVAVTPSPTPTPSVTPSPTPTPTATPSVTPSPTPVVTPSPTPSPAGGITIQNTNNNNNTNNNTNNNNINISTGTTAATTTVASVPVKQPETGVGVAGLATMFSAAPLGVVMSRYGKGRLFAKKQEEDSLSEIASDLVNSRKDNIA